MADCRVLCLCLLAALAQAATLHQVEEDGSSIMRRQKTTLVHLGPAGEIEKEESRVSVDLVHRRAKNPDAWCNAYYPLGEERTNTCTLGTHINSNKDCIHAAQALNLTIPDKFDTSEWHTNPLPVPKACFVTNGTAYFNPSGSDATVTISDGTPICKNLIYTDGTERIGSLATVNEADLCPSGYSLIDTWEECEWAHDCEYGGMYCEQVGAANENYQTEDRTPGCFRNHIGCFGFNSQPGQMSTWTDVDASANPGVTPVCKLATHQFTGHPKYGIGTTASPS